MIRVLVVEDSGPARALLVAVLRSDPEIEIVGEAIDGRKAVELAAELRPDLITMDINLPELDGFEATERILAVRPVPIVMVSALQDLSEAAAAGRALSAGALTVLRTPPSPTDPGFQDAARHILETVKVMARVRVPGSAGDPNAAKHVRQPPAPAPSTGEASRPPQFVAPSAPTASRVDVVAIVASTGGPQALHSILTALPRSFPVPILVIQHLTPGFVPGLVASWQAASALNVKLAEDGERLKPGTVYVAPDGRHMLLGKGGKLQLSEAQSIQGYRPSATYLFGTLPAAFRGRVACVVLTGEGSDGVPGLADIRRAGGVVIAQDTATAVVTELPQRVVEQGLADVELPLAAIPYQLYLLCGGEEPH